MSSLLFYSQITFFIATNVLLIFSAFLISSIINIKKGKPLAIFIFYLSIIILVLTGVGLIGKISFFSVYGIALFLSLVIIILILARERQGLDYLLNILNRFRSLSYLKKIILFVIIALFVVWLIGLMLTPIWDYDSLAYHLPFATQFIQNQSILEYYTIPAWGIEYYPQDIELIFTWFLLPFHFDGILHGLNLIFALLVFFAIYSILREFHISKIITWLTALSYVTIPIFLEQIGNVKIDIFFTLLFLCIIFFLLRFLQENEWGDFLIMAIAMGIFLGSRYLAIPYVIIPLVILFFSLYRKNRLKKFVFAFIILVLIIIGTGGYWYIRNYITTGNPIYPTEVSLFGERIFRGVAGFSGKNMVSTSLLGQLRDPSEILNYFIQYSLRAGLVFLLLLNAIILFIVNKKDLISKKINDLSNIFKKKNNFISRGKALIHVLLIKKIDRSNFTIVVLFFITFIYFFFYISAPNSFIHFIQNIRYSLPFIFLVIFIFVLIASQSSFSKSFAVILLVFFMGTNIIFSFFLPDPMRTFNFSLLQGTKMNIYEHLKTIYGDASLHRMLEWTDMHSLENTKIGYSGFTIHYPLFGKKLNRKVNYIHFSQCISCTLNSFTKYENNPYANPNVQEWLLNLNYYQTQYYLIYDPESQLPQSKWIHNYPHIFEVVYEDEGSTIYYVNQTNLSGQISF